MPPMILFSFVDLLYRAVDAPSHMPELHIELSAFANMLSIQVLHPGATGIEARVEDCLEAMGQIRMRFGEEVDIVKESHPFCWTVVNQAAFKEKIEEHPQEAVAG